jgi:hypothetical protein
MANKTMLYNPLIYIKDGQWLKFVALLTENVLAINGRILSKVEVLYSEGGFYPAVYFRLTTVLEDSPDEDLKPEISGFVLGFNNDWDEDVYLHPLSSQGYMEDWLMENNITSLFVYHDVGLRKLFKFLETELKLWETADHAIAQTFTPKQWQELAAS